MDSFSVERFCKNSKNIVIDTQYSHPSSKSNIFEKCSKNVLTKPKQEIISPYYRQLEFKST